MRPSKTEVKLRAKELSLNYSVKTRVFQPCSWRATFLQMVNLLANPHNAE